MVADGKRRAMCHVATARVSLPNADANLRPEPSHIAMRLDPAHLERAGRGLLRGCGLWLGILFGLSRLLWLLRRLRCWLLLLFGWSCSFLLRFCRLLLLFTGLLLRDLPLGHNRNFLANRDGVVCLHKHLLERALPRLGVPHIDGHLVGLNLQEDIILVHRVPCSHP